MTQVKIQAPIKVELKVIVLDDDGRTGEVTYCLPAMGIPTKEDIQNAINEVALCDVVKKNNMRVANKLETWQYIMLEKTGVDYIAMPGSQTEWDD